MIELAHKYSDELKLKLLECSLDPRYMYYFGEAGSYNFELGDNTVWRRDFVSVDKDGKLLGYIGYSISLSAGRAHSFGLISFDIGNLAFVRDAQKVFTDIFEKYHLNMISWTAYADNPVASSYRRMCEKFGGKEVAHERQVARLLDGQLHDSITWEISAEEYYASDFYKHHKDVEAYRKMKETAKKNPNSPFYCNDCKYRSCHYEDKLMQDVSIKYSNPHTGKYQTITWDAGDYIPCRECIADMYREVNKKWNNGDVELEC